MGTCNKDFVYCSDGCCTNVTITCCNVTCGSTDSYCMSGELIPVGAIIAVVAVFFGITALIICFIAMKMCKEFCCELCSCDCDCSDCDCCCCFRNISCDCCADCDTDKCTKCISCICLSPCLFMNWLSNESKDYTTRSAQNRESQNTDIQVAADQPEDANRHPVQPTIINISVYNDRDSNGCGAENSPPESRHLGGIGKTEPSAPTPPYHEATKEDPPSYFEAHNYKTKKILIHA